jgi:hypothetical protein
MTSEINTEEGRKWLKGLLRAQEATISFIKKDGTKRKMKCTLNEGMIPSDQMPKGSGKATSDEALAVFDLEKLEWRSFRYDSVKKVSFTIE